MIDAYKIGVTLALSSNGPQVLGALGKQMLGLHVSAQKLTQQFGMLKLAIGGALAAGLGFKGLESLWDLANGPAKDLASVQAQMLAAGRSHLEVAQATAAAYKTAGDVLGSNVVENLKLAADLGNLLGSNAKGTAALDEMAKIGITLNAFAPERASKNENDVAKFGMYLENRSALLDEKTGAISGAHLAQQARLGEAIIVAMRNRIDPAKLLAFQSQAGGAGAAMSDQGLMNFLPLILAYGRGDKVGTMLSSMDQQLLGGVQLSAHTAGRLGKLGILDPKKIHNGLGGKMVVDPGAIKDEDMFLKDPAQWVWTYLATAFQKEGVNTNDAAQVQKAVGGLGLRSTVSRMLIEIIRNAVPFQKDAARIAEAAGIIDPRQFGAGASVTGYQDRHSGSDNDPFETLEATDPTTKIKAFHEAWQLLLTALGSPLVDPAMIIMHKLTVAINDMGQWAAKHPNLAFDIEAVVASLSALAVVVGVGGVLAAALTALSGPVGIAVVAATAIGGLGAAIVVFRHDIEDWLHWIGIGSAGTPAAAGAAAGAPYNFGTHGGGRGGSYVPPMSSGPVVGTAANPAHVTGSVAMSNANQFVNGIDTRFARDVQTPSASSGAVDIRSGRPGFLGPQ